MNRQERIGLLIGLVGLLLTAAIVIEFVYNDHYSAAQWADYNAKVAARVRPDKMDAQICIINDWLRQHDPKSHYLPENGWTSDPAGYRCPLEPASH